MAAEVEVVMYTRQPPTWLPLSTRLFDNTHSCMLDLLSHGVAARHILIDLDFLKLEVIRREVIHLSEWQVHRELAPSYSTGPYLHLHLQLQSVLRYLSTNHKASTSSAGLGSFSPASKIFITNFAIVVHLPLIVLWLLSWVDNAS